MKIRFFIYLMLLTCSIYSNSFEDGLKMESIGDKSKAIKIYNNYFKKNINTLSFEELDNQVIHVATLYDDTDLSINFLKKISSLIDDRDKRNIIYLYIAHIYELTGEIFESGKYYEKASINSDSSRNYTTYLHSLELLQELGYIDKVHRKLIEIKDKVVITEAKDSYYNLLYRSYTLLGEFEKASAMLSKLEINHRLEKTDKYKLNTPNDHIFSENLTSKISHSRSAPKLTYIDLGIYNELPSGIINILEQLKLEWEYDDSLLTVISENSTEAEYKLKKAGISYDIR